ncbi:MAG TPA: FAD-dependent oxidoreductase [Patescibacteria group bacterium]|jgi:ferredoxin-NADP reductase|nr:FAD-dependent oxidoreductase [Patescibacteria group bacterium]
MSVTRSQHIPLVVTRRIDETPGYTSVFFERPRDFTYQAGDWVDIHFTGRTLRGGYTYSLSSSPLEPELRITFKNGISEFKQALQSLKPGQELYISQFGNDYRFQLKHHRASLLIAGGVGVAPFRSMLKTLYETHSADTVHLLYLNQTDDYLFQSELNEWADSLPHVDVSYLTTKGLSRKKRERTIIERFKKGYDLVYISGPPSMVESTEHLTIDHGIDPRSIRIDSFGGYD